jgi:hypothetical protein
MSHPAAADALEDDTDPFAPEAPGDLQHGPRSGPGASAVHQRHRGGSPLVPLLLLALALFDLRIELQLLADHVTLTSLMAAIRSHLLAVVVLLLQPSLWRHYRRRPS